MNKKTRSRTVLALLIIAWLSICFSPVNAIGETRSVEAANFALNTAFVNVLAAEEAGGNVTELLARLNSAGKLLAEAENTQKSGGTTNVVANAESARQIADQVNKDAIRLLNSSLAQSEIIFWSTIALSTTGAIVLTLVLCIIWKQFKRRYMNRLLGLKPEVAKGAA